jgi:sugar lactone lactonase YvrE
MVMKLRRLTIPVLVVPLLVLTTAATSNYPESIPLPVDFGAEGVAVGTGHTFYAGSLYTGEIVSGDLRTGAVEHFADGAGTAAVGLKVDEPHHLLVVAGGASGQGIFYDLRDPSSPLTRALASPAPSQQNPSLINDVAVTRDAAYFTDTVRPAIYKVPIGPGGSVGQAETITVTGPAAEINPENPLGLNGIDVTPDGATLIVGNSGMNGVYTVDPATGASALILDGLAPSNDGILLDGHTLWVVANFSNAVQELRLSPDYSTGTVVDTITNDEVGGLFRIPTTVAEHGNKLVLVNGRFDLGFPPPFGPGAPPGTDFDAVQIDKP